MWLVVTPLLPAHPRPEPYAYICIVFQVIRGYIGDQSAKPVFDSPTPFDILGTGYQRPFELATLRLFNMMGILPKCGWMGAWGGQQGGRADLQGLRGTRVSLP